MTTVGRSQDDHDHKGMDTYKYEIVDWVTRTRKSAFLLYKYNTVRVNFSTS